MREQMMVWMQVMNASWGHMMMKPHENTGCIIDVDAGYAS